MHNIFFHALFINSQISNYIHKAIKDGRQDMGLTVKVELWKQRKAKYLHLPVVTTKALDRKVRKVLQT